MRTLLATLAAVVVGATVFTGIEMTNPVAGHATPVDTTVSVRLADQPTDYPTCARWGLHFGEVTITGTRTTTYGGCVNVARPGDGDSFTGHLAQYIRDNSK
jgi:hypothetical protein